MLKLPIEYANMVMNNKAVKLLSGNVASDYILYPILMEVVKNKTLVLIILAFV